MNLHVGRSWVLLTVADSIILYKQQRIDWRSIFENPFPKLIIMLLIQQINSYLLLHHFFMIDQERQADFKYGPFDVSLRMCPQDVLSIFVENTTSLDKFKRLINHQYISQQDNFFQSVFEGAQDVYDCLNASINEIVIQGEFLLFDYEYGKNKKMKRISIQLLREDMDQFQLADLKVEKMKAYFTSQLLQRDRKFNVLEENYQKLASELKKYTETNEAVMQSLEVLRGELESEKSKNRELSLKIGQLQLHTLGHHPNNPHKQYYTLTWSSITSIKVSRIGENGRWYNFMNNCEILPNQKVKYSLTINKTTSCSIMIGFCTEKGLGNNNNYSNVESAYYYCGGNSLWQGGSQKQIGIGCVGGETVECVADLTSSKLSWWKKGSLIGECSVPAEMRSKPIYISILIYYIGDEVDLCLN